MVSKERKVVFITVIAARERPSSICGKYFCRTFIAATLAVENRDCQERRDRPASPYTQGLVHDEENDVKLLRAAVEMTL